MEIGLYKFEISDTEKYYVLMHKIATFEIQPWTVRFKTGWANELPTLITDCH